MTDVDDDSQWQDFDEATYDPWPHRDGTRPDNVPYQAQYAEMMAPGTRSQAWLRNSILEMEYGQVLSKSEKKTTTVRRFGTANIQRKAQGRLFAC